MRRRLVAIGREGQVGWPTFWYMAGKLDVCVFKVIVLSVICDLIVAK